MTRSTRPIVRAAAALGVVAAALTFASPAWAHVEAEGATAAGGLTSVTFSFEHGCAESPTTSLKVKLPDGTTEVTTENPTGWTSTSDSTQIQWTGGPIAADQPGEFTATMRLVGTKGDTVYLPTIQGCEQGENTWIELTTDPEADDAAPRITLTETVAAAATTTAAPTETTIDDAAASAAANDAKIVKDSENSPIGAIVIVIVVAIIVIGGVVLYLRNRRPSAS